MKIGIIGLGTVGEGVLKILALENKNIKLKESSNFDDSFLAYEISYLNFK